MKTIKILIAELLAVCLLLPMLAFPAGAYERVDVSREVSLSLTYTDADRERPVSGMEVSLYKVYAMTDAVRFTPTDSFSGAYGGEFHFDLYDGYWLAEGSTQLNWPGMAATLESLLRRDLADGREDLPQPVLSGETDEEGTVAFQGSAESPLLPGLYLVMGEPVESGRYTYTPQTFLVALPHLSAEDTWEYTLSARGKMDTDYDAPEPGGSDTVSVTVNKVWEDAGGEERPSSVSVALLRDGERYRSTTLSEENGWRHTWGLLPDDHRYTVAETAVADGYTVSIDRNGSSFTITNTAAEGIDDPDTPLTPGPGDEGDQPDQPDIEELPDDPTPEAGLPQTGTLWWPVQVLTIAGILLFSIGWLGWKRGKKDHEA